MARRLSSGVLAMIRLTNLFPLALLCASASSAAERLGGYLVDPPQASVSGISSGPSWPTSCTSPVPRRFWAPLIAGDLYGCAVLHATADGVQAPASQAAGPCLSTAFLMEHVAFAFGAVVKTRQRLAPVLNAIMIC